MSKEMSKEIRKQLAKCPFCGGEAELMDYYESCDGRGDRFAIIKCLECTVEMQLTWKEFKKAEEDFGYTGGYFSQNKVFWEGMHKRLVDKWNTRKPTEKIVERLKESLDKTMEENSQEWDSYYRKVNVGKCVAFRDAIEIVKEEGGMNE